MTPRPVDDLSQSAPSLIEPLRIIIVMPSAPLPFGNAAARWYHVVLRELVARGHRVTAFAACGDHAEIEQCRAVLPAPRYDVRCYGYPSRTGLGAKWETVRRPFSYMFGHALRDGLAAEVEAGFDVLHLEQLWTGWLGLRCVDQAVVNVHYLASIDLADPKPRSPRARLTHAMMFRAENHLLRTFHHFRTLTPRLVDPILRVNPDADVSSVALGLDTTLYQYIPVESRPTSLTVGLIGSMDWYPSLSAAIRLITRIWPAVRARLPTATLRIAGWSARAALRDHVGAPGVEIYEDIEDIREFFAGLTVLAYPPVHGSGMKVKVLEAMAFGVPVVTTSEGVEGLPAHDGVHAGVSDDDGGLIDRIVEVASDLGRQERQRIAARALVEAWCSPRRTVDELERVYAKMLGRSAAAQLTIDDALGGSPPGLS